jgi:hypothetical protein
MLKPKRRRRTKREMAEARASKEMNDLLALAFAAAAERLKNATPGQIAVGKRLLRQWRS